MGRSQAENIKKENNMARNHDGNMEIRAMILSALPYPPIPVSLRRLDEDNRLGDGVVQTTHDILSHLLEDACARHTVSQNKSRQQVQQYVLRQFLEELVKDGLQSVPDLYKTYCKFSNMHIGSYLYAVNSGQPLPEVRFEPLHSVCKGDVVHTSMCQYMAGQARLLEFTDGLCAQDWACREYADMLVIARDRIVCEGDEENVVQGPIEPVEILLEGSP